MNSPFHIYCSGHINSRTVCEAMAEGTGFPIVPPMPLQPGGVILYGQLRGLQETLQAAKQQGREFLYCDRGYLCATKGKDFSGYFRVTRNAYQHSGLGDSDGKRFRDLGLKIQPWKTTGEHIIVCPPSDVWSRFIGLEPDQWLKDIIAELRLVTKRKIITRNKQSLIPLEDDLVMCHAVVTHSSNVAVLALLQGIPVVASSWSCCCLMSTPLCDIDSPFRPGDRERFFGVLADNQFTLAEMRSGLAWEMLKGNK